MNFWYRSLLQLDLPFHPFILNRLPIFIHSMILIQLPPFDITSRTLREAEKVLRKDKFEILGGLVHQRDHRV